MITLIYMQALVMLLNSPLVTNGHHLASKTTANYSKIYCVIKYIYKIKMLAVKNNLLLQTHAKLLVVVT